MILWRMKFFSHLILCFAVAFYAQFGTDLGFHFFPFLYSACLCYFDTSFPGEVSLSRVKYEFLNVKYDTVTTHKQPLPSKLNDPLRWGREEGGVVLYTSNVMTCS